MSSWRDLIRDAGIPQRDAELLLLHCLQRDRAWLYSHGAEPAQETAVKHFDRCVKLRSSGAPIAYITGTREFWSLELEVSSGVLIPRSDTELLVAQALERSIHLPKQVLDLGTGSGAVALALAREWQQRVEDATAYSVTAVDRSEDALAVARRNGTRLGLTVEWLQSDWFSALAERRWPLIVSNPPYIADDDPHLSQGDLPAEPLVALVSGQDGLDAMRRIISDAPQYMEAGGWLLLEHGWNQADAVRGLMANRGFQQVSSYRDLAGHERVTEGQWR